MSEVQHHSLNRCDYQVKHFLVIKAAFLSQMKNIGLFSVVVRDPVAEAVEQFRPHLRDAMQTVRRRAWLCRPVGF